jgi:uncharacterized protein (TIGR00266 family)
MPFCTSCGGELGAQTKFCGRCGTPLGGAQAPGGYATSQAPSAVQEPLEFSVQGDNLQVARVRLKPGQELFAEAGKMVYKTPAVLWETRMSGSSLGEKIWGALRRKLAGESLFFTYFHAVGQGGEIGFAGSYPGKIQTFDLAPGQSILVQRDGFLFAQSSVQFSVAFVKRLGAGFFGGEGFILEKMTGPGTVFIHGGGDFVEFNLAPGEMLQVDTGCIVAFDESVGYDIEYVGGIKNAFFGGEGIFLATLRGPGRCVIQSLTLNRLRRELAPNNDVGGDERNPLQSLTGILRSDD